MVNITVLQALITVFLLLIENSNPSSLFDKLPRNSDIFVSSDLVTFLNTFNSFDRYDIALDNHGATNKIVHILEKPHSPYYGVLVLLLNHSNNSDSVTILQEISKFHSDESRLKRPLSIFIATYSSTDNELLQLKLSKASIKMSWQISTFLVQLDEYDSYKIVSVWELVTIIEPYTIQISLEEVGPDFFDALLNRESKKNLHGSVVRALAIDSPDERYSAVFNKNNDSMLTFSAGGYTVSLLHDLKDSLNFSVVAVLGQEYITDQSANNTVGGMGAQLLKEEADVIITMSYALEFRLQYLSPTVSFNQDKVMVFFRQPQMSLHRNIFFHPFQDMVWISLLLAVSLIAGSTFVIVKLQFFWGLRKNQKQKYFWILGALCQKSCSCIPMQISGRIAFFITFLMSYTIYTFYSASIISRLSVSYNPITNLMGLISSQFNLLVDPLSFAKFLKFTGNQFWEKSFVSEMDSVSKIFKGGFGYISSIDLVVIASRNLGYSDEVICDTLSSVSFNGIVMPLQFFTRKGYPFKELINRKLLNSMGKGLNHRYRTEFLRHTNPICPVITHATFQTLGLANLCSAFLGLVFAYVVTSITLLVEKYILIRYKECQI